MKKHKILLIRHAEISGNAQKRYMGCKSDVPVSESGLTHLQKVDIDGIGKYDRIFCGPMKRCVTTAEYLFPDREIQKIDSMTEMDFGLYEGKNYEELKDDPYYQKWIDSGGTLPFPEGEDMAGFSERSRRAFEEIVDMLNDGESAAIVCHSGNIMGIMSSLTDCGYFDFGVGNLEGFVLEIECDGEIINVLSYERFGVGMRT